MAKIHQCISMFPFNACFNYRTESKELTADTFDNFIRCYVALQQADKSAVGEPTPHCNAFNIITAAQRERISRVFPDKIVVRNKKDQLFNDMMIEKNGNHLKLTVKLLLMP